MRHRRKQKRKTYAFTHQGIGNFENIVFSEITKALANDTMDEYGEIQIKIGENYISVPLYAEAYENIMYFLKTTLKEIEQC